MQHALRVDRAHAPHKEVIRLAAATAIGASGLAAGGNASALLAVDVTRTDASAGVPIAVMVFGSAVGAVIITRLGQHSGRPRALACGYLLGSLGAVLSVAAAEVAAFDVLLVGSALLGCANSAVFLSRYAASELGERADSGRGLGLVLFGTAIGAVLSPQLLGPSATLAAGLELPPLSGMFVLAAVVFGLAGLGVSRAPTRCTPSIQPRAPLRRLPAVPIATLAVTNLLMIGVMVAVPVHLTHAGIPLSAVGLMISVHVAGMLGPSPLTGWLADRCSARAVLTTGLAVLVSVGVLGMALPPDDAPSMLLLILLLGLGWNCGVVAGSALLVTTTPPEARDWAEALGEIGMSGGAAVAAPLAGLALATAGLTAVWLGVAIVAVLAAVSLAALSRLNAATLR